MTSASEAGHRDYLAGKKLYQISGKPQKKRGGGLCGCATKEKKNFFLNVRKKVPMTTKPRGGGLKALVAGPLKKSFMATAMFSYHFRNKLPWCFGVYGV